MSTRINLLPWREERRKQRERRVYGLFLGAVVLGGLVWFLGHSHLEGRIDFQRARNAFLESEIQALDQRIVKIRDLESTKNKLLARMRVIQDLQQGRPRIVHLFEQFVTTLPNGLYLTRIEEKGAGYTIIGVAESNSRVSNYMENLEESGWLADPDLSVIEVREREGTRVSNFTLTVKQEQGQPPAAAEGRGAST